MSGLNYYYDNAATSFPKPREVAVAMSDYINNCGGTYGRAAYRRVVDATLLVEDCRDSLADLLNCDSESVFFTHNATHGANLILRGLYYNKSDVVAVSPLEHNAVMRPLEYVCGENNLTYKVFPHFDDGLIDLGNLEQFLVENSVTLLVINHQSNVNGLIQPLESVCCIAKRCGVRVVVDATQSIGVVPLDLEALDVDFLFFTGHKNLHGPTGVGGVYIKDISSVKPLIFGGTGSNSDSYVMPSHAPDVFEAGTPNISSIVGLNAALNVSLESKHSKEDFLELVRKVKKCENVVFYGANDETQQGEVFSLTHKSLNVSQFSDKLYKEFKIEVRSGLHCSPLAHKTLGTFAGGTVRISLSSFHSKQDLDYLLDSIKSV